MLRHSLKQIQEDNLLLTDYIKELELNTEKKEGEMILQTAQLK